MHRKVESKFRKLSSLSMLSWALLGQRGYQRHGVNVCRRPNDEQQRREETVKQYDEGS
jgi:hypothetical protein